MNIGDSQRKDFEMKLSDNSLEVLREVIINSLTYHYSESGRRLRDEEITNELMEFFLDINEGGQLDAPTSGSYARGILRQHNGTDFIKKSIEKVLSPKLEYDSVMGGPAYGATNEFRFCKMLVPMLDLEGYKLVIVRKTIVNSHIDGIYYLVLDEKEFAKTPAMEESKPAKNIKEEAEKRFAEENYPAAITSCFTLVETVIKDMLDELGIEYKESAQFVVLYPKLTKALNLNPAGENIESYLQKILQGLENQMNGLYHLGNKAGNRHKLKYPPKRQDAKLAMNATFTLCEYLSDTHKSRQAQ